MTSKRNLIISAFVVVAAVAAYYGMTVYRWW